MRFRDACRILGFESLHDCITAIRELFTAIVAAYSGKPHAENLRRAAAVLSNNPDANSTVLYAVMMETIINAIELARWRRATLHAMNTIDDIIAFHSINDDDGGDAAGVAVA